MPSSQRTELLPHIPLACLLAGLVFAAAWLLVGTTPGSADPSLDSEEQALLQHLNAYRSQHGAGPLIIQSQLTNAADWFAKDMATKNYFGHIDSLGRTPGKRAAAFGYVGQVGENLAASVSTGKGTLDAWGASAGHNSNMLDPKWNVVGIARAYDPGSSYKWYWVAKFSSTQIVSYNSAWGDSDCDGSITIGDALRVARGLVGLNEPLVGCPTIGDLVLVNGAVTPWGDIDCDGWITVGDAQKIARKLAGLSVPQPSGCPSIGG